jgi:RNA polymerase sigma factor (sigma-70 family)
MIERDSVSQWILGLKGGDPAAARKLWELYFDRLLRLVNRKLPRHLRRAFDEEDVALSAFKSLCAGVVEGRFPQLEDRGNLWNVLVVIAARKAQAYLRHHNRRKRGGGQVLGESGVRRPSDDLGPVGLEEIVGAEPTPEFAAQVAEEYQRLLGALGDDDLRNIAVLKMQGYNVEEIAERSGSTRRTIERRLQIIRRTWSEKELTV